MKGRPLKNGPGLRACLSVSRFEIFHLALKFFRHFLKLFGGVSGAIFHMMMMLSPARWLEISLTDGPLRPSRAAECLRRGLYELRAAV
jgi:hypothetical protein